jgi:cytochrome c6
MQASLDEHPTIVRDAASEPKANTFCSAVSSTTTTGSGVTTEAPAIGSESRMRRIAFALVAVLFVFGVAACGGEEEASPEPEDTTGTITTTDTETTGTETTETTETTGTETTETTETGGGAPAEGDAAAGKQIFLGAAGCGTCHTLADAGTSGTIGPNLDEAKPSFELAVDRVTNGAGAMPSFSGQLSDQQIVDVATYVSSVAGT